MSKPNNDRLIYDGKYQPSLNPTPTDDRGRKYYPYIADPDLIEAVNLAIALKRPLLLEGEPGCGKTMLADAIVYEFSHQYKDRLQDKKEWWPYYIWNVKSTERAQNGLYTFDGIARLRDAQLAGAMNYLSESESEKKEIKEIKARFQDKAKYLTFGALGKALTEEMPEGVRPILLIDEIDKADPDFANDLLLELDRNRFDIPETGESHSRECSDCQPIVIITSNRERPLPEAFLRRCLYYHVGFPDDAALKAIIDSHFTGTQQHFELINNTIEKIKEIRDILSGQPGSKLPGTSEVIDLLRTLLDPYRTQSLKDLANLAVKLPLLGIVLKTQADQRLYQEELGVNDEDR
jgi:MoxR-like ATPase